MFRPLGLALRTFGLQFDTSFVSLNFGLRFNNSFVGGKPLAEEVLTLSIFHIYELGTANSQQQHSFKRKRSAVDSSTEDDIQEARTKRNKFGKNYK